MNRASRSGDLGTVADVVPLLGENRILARRALDGFAGIQRPGLLALLDLVKVIPAQVTSQTIAYRIAPRLNAAGRMDHSRFALDLLMTRDPDVGRELALHLHQLNLNRQSLETKIFTEAAEIIEREGQITRGEPVLVVSGEGWHRGVLGIVAARLVQYYQRPVFLMTVEEGIAHGSARTVDGLNLLPLLDAARPYAISCGGHEEAAGMKVELKQIQKFKEAIGETRPGWGSKPAPALWIDASPPRTGGLGPLGRNPAPGTVRRATRNRCSPSRAGGDGGADRRQQPLAVDLAAPAGIHQRHRLRPGDKLEQLAGGPLEIAFTCQINEYRGRRDIDLHLKDIRPAPSSAPSIATRTPEPVKSAWDRQRLGRLYMLLQKSCNEDKIIALQNAELLAKIAKMSLKDFHLGLKIFTELELLSIRDGKILIHPVEVKRELTESPTFRSLASPNAQPER